MAQRGVWAEISLGALRHNIRKIQAKITGGAKFCAVVKANAYGHGAIAVAHQAVALGADYLAVAVVEEAAFLRQAGITAPILLLGPATRAEADDIVALDVTAAVFTREGGAALSRAALRQHKTVKVHLAVDTGMGRIGVHPKDAAETAKKIAALPNVELEGVFSHFALADIPDKTFTRNQVKLFQEACNAIEAVGIHIPIKHIAESAAILEIPAVHFDMVRAGIIQYGLWPSDEVTRPIELRQCMKFCARIVYVKTIQPGESVGYGRKFIAERETRIATLPVGYADGYIRAYAGGSVEVCGKRAPIAGRVCMDQFMIDITDIPEAQMGDVCTLFGSETLPTDEVAGWANTINYEVVCLVSERVPRVYVK